MKPHRFSYPVQDFHYGDQLKIRLLWSYEGLVHFREPYVWEYFYRPLSSLCVLEGRVDLKFADIEWSLQDGECVILPMGEYRMRQIPGAVVCSTGCEVFGDSDTELPHFRPIRLSHAQGRSLLKASRQIQSKTHGQNSFWSSVKFTPGSLTQYAAIHSALWNWLTEIFRQIDKVHKASKYPAMHPQVRRLMQRLSCLPLNEGLATKCLAAELNMTWRRLEQLFKEETGTTPSRFLEQRRVWAAYNQLAAGSVRIKEVAYGLGFKQQSNFSRWFCRAFGMPPNVFRERIKSKPSGF